MRIFQVISTHPQNSPPLVGHSRQLQIYPRYLRKGSRVNPLESQFPIQLDINNTLILETRIFNFPFQTNLRSNLNDFTSSIPVHEIIIIDAISKIMDKRQRLESGNGAPYLISL